MKVEERNWKDWRMMLTGDVEKDAEWLASTAEQSSHIVHPLKNARYDEILTVSYSDGSRIQVVYEDEEVALYGISDSHPSPKFESVL